MAITPRVFVVDDDPSVFLALKRLLRSSGFEVETFARGEDFLGAVSSEATGCLILDVHMSGMDGFAGDTWYLDELFVTIQGRRQSLWRAVDQDGDVIDILVQPRRDRRAAARFDE